MKIKMKKEDERWEWKTEGSKDRKRRQVIERKKGGREWHRERERERDTHTYTQARRERERGRKGEREREIEREREREEKRTSGRKIYKWLYKINLQTKIEQERDRGTVRKEIEEKVNKIDR